MLNNKLDLRVLILTFIFNSPEMLDKDILGDYFSSDKKKKEKSIGTIFNILNTRCNVNNLDEIIMLLNMYHNVKKNNEHSLRELYYLDKLAEISKMFISTRNGKFILKYWKSENEELLGAYTGINKIAMWNTLSREIHMDNLVFQYLISNGMNDKIYLNGYHSLIHIEDLQLEQILNKGVAETHLHINAGIYFEVKWQYLMNSDVEKLKLKGIDIVSYGKFSKDNIKKYINLACIIRILVSYFLKNRRNEKNIYVFFKKLDSIFEGAFSVTRFIEEFLETETKKLDAFKIKEFLEILKISFNIKNQNSYEEDFWNVRLNKADFLSNMFNCENINFSLESMLMFECFSLLDKKNENNLRHDKIFVKLVYRYILIKNIIYKLFTQDNKIKGLDKFVESFEMTSEFNVAAQQRLQLALHCQLQNTNIVKLEFRQSLPFDKSRSKIKKSLIRKLIPFFEFYKHIITDYKKNKRQVIPNIGVIYHLKKQKDDINKCWYMYSKDNNNYAYYSKIRDVYRNQINSMRELRETIPYLSNYILGIDAASIEYNADPWVFAPIFRLARDGEYKMLCKENGAPIANLGFTFHVGEEFRHIMSGLRNIYEVITHLKFRSGDRIGHGIALGIDIEKWVIENRVVIMPRIEYLENLLWMWHMLTNGCIDYDYDINPIERKIIDVASDIYGYNKPLTVNMLYKAYLEKFKDSELNNDYGSSSNKNVCNECNYECKDNMFFCYHIKNCNNTSWDVRKLKYTNHCNVYLKKMNEPIETKIDIKEINIFKELQKRLKKIISVQGIVVETNPTSNRVIGQIQSIFEHYISNLNNICNDDENIIVTINTDDPSVFNSNINNEYAYIFYSLIDKGFDRTLCLNWINKVRKMGINSSFIKERNMSINEIGREVDEILKKLIEMRG